MVKQSKKKTDLQMVKIMAQNNGNEDALPNVSLPNKTANRTQKPRKTKLATDAQGRVSSYKNNMEEKRLEREIINTINCYEHFICFKNGEQATYNSRYVINGMADIGVIDLRGNGIIFMEVKTKRGRQRDSQAKFEMLCKQAGIPYYIVRSVKEALDACQ